MLTILVGGARLLYAGLKLLPVQRKVVLITREPKRITVDFALLQEAVQRDYPEHTVVLIKHKKLSFAYAAKAVREMYQLATCQACVVDGYIIPVSILNHREQLRIAQVWHALGAIKNFGHLAPGPVRGPIPRWRRSCRCISSTPSSPPPVGAGRDLHRSFGVPQEAVHPLGMPRVDYLLDRERMDGRRAEILEATRSCRAGRWSSTPRPSAAASTSPTPGWPPPWTPPTPPWSWSPTRWTSPRCRRATTWSSAGSSACWTGSPSPIP